MGHSCGGSLALQIAMSGGKKWSNAGEEGDPGEEEETPMPMAIAPVEAITDIPALVASHTSQPMYAEFVLAAFGSERGVWNAASPVSGAYGVKGGWRGGKLVMLAHSQEDELVEWEQCDIILKVLKEQGWREEKDKGADGDSKAVGEQKVVVFELKGKHDEIWEKGEELARTIEAAVQKLVQRGCIGG